MTEKTFTVLCSCRSTLRERILDPNCPTHGTAAEGARDERARKPYEPPRVLESGHMLIAAPFEIDARSVTGSNRSIAELARQIERESALRRAIAGACPLLPIGAVHGFVAELIKWQIELELQALEQGDKVSP